MPIRKGPRPLSRLLARDKTLKNLICQSGDNELLLQSVRSRLPDPLCDHCVGAVLDQKNLILFVDSSIWATRLRFLQNKLKVDLAPLKVHFTNLKVKVFHPSGKATHNPRHPQAPLNRVNAEIIEHCASTTSDEQLSKALLRLAEHVKK